jgi:prepilin-type processing-associated H-X9-DG protein
MPAFRQSRRQALTITEALVLLVLAAVIVGLAVAAIQSSREQSRRLLCENNLKEIGRAIHLFSNQQGALPASRIADRYATWAVQIAPFLPGKDMDELLKKWDQELSYDAQPADVRAAQVSLYYCPARRLPPQVSVAGDVAEPGPGQANVPGALGDYACAAGDDDPAHPWQSASADGAIILGKVLEKDGERIRRWQARTRLESLPRGKTHTILVGEKHVPRSGFGQVSQGDGSLYDGNYPASFSRIGGSQHGLAQSPDDAFRDNFGSYHPGICQFLFADGHVEPVTNAISGDILGRLLNRLSGDEP